MNYSILFFELSLSLGMKDFEKLLERAYENSKIYLTDFGHIDKSFVNDGIGIKYHDDSKRRKITLTIYPSLLIGDYVTELWKPTSGNISRLCKELEKFLDSYFYSDYVLDDFKLSCIDYAANIDIGSWEKVSGYIKVLNNIGRVKCFSPIKHSNHDGGKGNFFGLKGNSNGVEFRVYGLKNTEGILRAELLLTKKDVIRAYSGGTDTSRQIKAMAKGSEHVFMDTFEYIVPRGDHYKLNQAKEIITGAISGPLRNKMLKLLELIPTRKSLLLAQKTLNCRNIADVMMEFDNIDISPITLPKRYDGKKLNSLYSYLNDQ